MATITITGSGFTGATQCFFGLTAAGITVNSIGTTFIAIPPAASAGGVTLTVIHPGGSASYYPYTYVGSPTITSLGSTMGSIIGGTRIKIIGTNFYDRSEAAFPGFSCGVTFGTTSANAILGGTTWANITAPAASLTGPVEIKFRTPSGIATGLTFTYIDYCTCPVDFTNEICATATGDCIEAHGLTGCNCCACCEAMCDYDPQCCDTGWNETCVDNLILFTECSHLLQGACCVKFNDAGISYGICLGSGMTLGDCQGLVDNLNTNNEVFPWNFNYTVHWTQNKTCKTGCDIFCPESMGVMYYDDGFKCGVPESTNCGANCAQMFGYCGGCVSDYCTCNSETDPDWCIDFCGPDIGGA